MDTLRQRKKFLRARGKLEVISATREGRYFRLSTLLKFLLEDFSAEIIGSISLILISYQNI